MQYEDVFVHFWEHVKESIEEQQFAKLTMAKTIGKPDLRNIFVRPVYSENGFNVLLKMSYRDKETEDKEEELSLEDALVVLKSHFKKPFLSVLLFTTKKDVVFKINKKGAGNIVEAPPSFSGIVNAKIEEA